MLTAVVYEYATKAGTAFSLSPRASGRTPRGYSVWRLPQGMGMSDVEVTGGDGGPIKVPCIVDAMGAKLTVVRSDWGGRPSILLPSSTSYEPFLLPLGDAVTAGRAFRVLAKASRGEDHVYYRELGVYLDRELAVAVARKWGTGEHWYRRVFATGSDPMDLVEYVGVAECVLDATGEVERYVRNVYRESCPSPA